MKNKFIIIIVIITLLTLINLAFASMELPPEGYDRPIEKTIHYNIIRNQIITGRTDTAVGYRDIIFDEGDNFNVGIKVINKNDVDIPFNIQDITVHDHFKLQPNTERWSIQDRINPSKVDFCELSYPRAQQIVSADSEKIINVSISCREVSCIKKYEHENACWFTLIPKIIYNVDGKDKEITSYDYYVESFKLKTDKPSEPSDNLGQKCSNSNDCITGFCFVCPSDTKAVIQGSTMGGEGGFCAPRSVASRQCEGSWNNDNYYIFTSYDTKDSSINKELTQMGLNKWKELVLNDISNSYFNNHIDIVNIGPQIEGDILGMGIQYQFKYNWAGTGGTDREVIYIKKKVDESWIWLTDNEIKQKFEESRNFLHNFKDSHGNIGFIKPTEEEIPSIVSEEEAIKKLKECHDNMDPEKIGISSVNNSLLFTAAGHVNIDTKNCERNLKGKFTVISGTVNLVTGGVECQSHESACAVYASEEQVRTKQQQKGLFRKIINWFKNLFG